MAWWLGTVGAYVVLLGVALEAAGGQLSAAFAVLGFIGLIVVNFIGIGLMVRDSGEGFQKGIVDGLRLGGSWLGVMLLIVGTAAAFFVLRELGVRW